MTERPIQAHRTRHWWAWFGESLISTIVGLVAAVCSFVLIEILVLAILASTLPRGGLGAGFFAIAVALLGGISGSGLIFGLASSSSELCFLRKHMTAADGWKTIGSVGWALGVPAAIYLSQPDRADVTRAITALMIVAVLIGMLRWRKLRRSTAGAARVALINVAASLLVLSVPLGGAVYQQNIGVLYRSDSARREQPSRLVNMNGKLLFTAGHPSRYGSELWISDGTAQGTTRLRDLENGRDDNQTLNMEDIAVAEGRLFFTVPQRDASWALWVSNGTATGTVRIATFDTEGPNVWEGRPKALTPVGSTVFFFAPRSASSYGLWRSDGTLQGTTFVKDAVVWDPSFGSKYAAGPPVVLDDILYFVAFNEQREQVLWRSDGTAAGTLPVIDVLPDVTSETPSNLTVVGSRLFFTTFSSDGAQLWKSDGSRRGTVLVKTLFRSDREWQGLPREFTIDQGRLYFIAGDGNSGIRLWRSDGTEGGTTPIADSLRPAIDFRQRTLISAGSLIFYQTEEPQPSYAAALWRTDRSLDGALLLRPGITVGLTAVGERLFFLAAGQRDSYDLWVSNGTGPGTVRVKNFPRANFNDLGPHHLVDVAGTLYFVHGFALWRSDGTAAGTILVKDIAS